ncbi:MAG: hypothetical protein RQ745_12395 [Longimicrobiales bacterium]|nr:hypothetical protein [Longimicrobiales bacterium]
MRSGSIDGIWTTLRGIFKQMASRQEIHYASNGSYTTDLDAMAFELPDEVRVDFLNAGPTGWTGIATHPPTGAFCLISCGLTVPMGWQSGAVTCPGA